MKRFQQLAVFCAAMAWVGCLWSVQPAWAGSYVLGWGNNSAFQAAPTPTNVFSGASAVSAGYWHSMVLKDGRVFSWGDNTYGQTNVPLQAQSDVFAIAGGGVLGMALKDGGVVAWGAATGATDVPQAAHSDVTAIAAGCYHGLALKNGGLLAWGDLNEDRGQFTVPTHLQSGVADMAAGQYFSVALTTAGGVEVFGIEADDAEAYGIRDVPPELSSGVSAVAAGPYHALALKDGGVVMWGFNATNGAVPVEAMSGVSAIDAGYDYSVALKEDGQVVLWGESVGLFQLEEMPSALSAGVIQISAGYGHCLSIGLGLPPRWIGDYFPQYINPGYSYTGNMNVTGDPAVVYSKVGDWPAWLTLNPASGVVGGRAPDTLGMVSISILASNLYGSMVRSYSFQITDMVLEPPSFITTNLPDGEMYEEYWQQLEASYAPVFSVVEGEGSGLPPGLVLTAEGVLSGTPSETYESFFLIRAANDVGAVTQVFNMVVAEPSRAPAFATQSPLPPATNGMSYILQMAADKGAAFSLSAGALPEGLSMGATGQISGTPTQYGRFGFTIRASNQVGGTSSNFILEVYSAPVFITTSLPAGDMGVAYSADIVAQGHPAPTFAVSSGALPGGLSLASNGIINGMPTAEGTFRFTVQATTFPSGTATREYHLTIHNWLPAYFTELRSTNEAVHMGWTNPNAAGHTRLWMSTNLVTLPEETRWTNLGVQTSPFVVTNIPSHKVFFYRLTVEP
ncbi:MAG: putative Ig domain-containing protein [Verrucomicrobiota bacterium]|jgi:hypothetical protein|nr:putative Ig domain-containing protein [Verrucomicrobiota bacterium]